MGKESDASITTVLGSCVAVTLFSPGRFWAICHGVLPSRDYSVERETEPGYYVADAIPAMLQQAKRLKVSQEELIAKLFGGASMSDSPPYQSVGELNIKAAEEHLADAGIQLAAQDVGGCQGRKLVFVPSKGDVFIKRLGDRHQLNERA